MSTKGDDDRQYLFVIRHGDRWDYSFPEWKKRPTSRLGDSPLSPLGHEQATEVGKFLDSWLSERNFTADDMTWMTSPFLRCIQTSNSALNAFRSIDVSSEFKMYPEYSIFEWDGQDGKWHEDLPPLEERVNYYPRVDISYKSMFVPTLPEPRSAFMERCERVAEAFDQRHPYKPRQVFFMVSHAAGCVAMSKALSGLELNEITPAGPCSIYMFSRTSGSEKWSLDPHDQPNSMNGYTGHLSNMGTKTLPWNHFGDGTKKFYTGPKNSRLAPPE
mmetsp:Transcript_12460/g.29214  ORF Transcript_12460/g.29214 Transcript_12460/m.29214 type:complete len:273 (+) Transcript_12460:49-867(+)